jgi:methylphosphotriester-DNA--protein-cysteine methyltransferase
MARPGAYTLIGVDGQPCSSAEKGTIGGHRGTKIFGRLDCSTARRAIARGGYVNHRVFFVDPDTATRAGYRPCAVCMPAAYQTWKARQASRRPAAAPPAGGRGA